MRIGKAEVESRILQGRKIGNALKAVKLKKKKIRPMGMDVSCSIVGIRTNAEDEKDMWCKEIISKAHGSKSCRTYGKR